MLSRKISDTCLPGCVKAQVLVVADVQEIESAQDRIIVTKMTDPGWVYLLTQAKGIIADRKSTRLNSSHHRISYAVFCLKKKKR